MEIPYALRAALEQQAQGTNQTILQNDAKTLSTRYRTESGTGIPLLKSDSEALAYAIARMPATYGAVFSALKNSIAFANQLPETLLDAGAGTGAASWAADLLLDLKSIVCLEREYSMRRLGEKIAQEGSNALKNAKWIQHDLSIQNISQSAELVIASYVLNEMTDEIRYETIEKLWNATEIMLLLIEPGTPVGFANLQKIRSMLLLKGAHIVAPCTHEKECPIQQRACDWCHFVCRIPRSSLHRRLKSGEAPYEDEKYAYLAFTKEKIVSVQKRVLRHPQIHSGYVELEICTPEGISNIKFSKKDGKQYKEARKANAGDFLEF